MIKTQIISLFLLHCLFQFSTALYFHIGETERKCFIEEIPDETTVLGKWFIFVWFNPNIIMKTNLPLFFLVHYKIELYDPRSGGYAPPNTGIGMHAEVKDPDEKVILSRVYSAEGKISFDFVYIKTIIAFFFYFFFCRSHFIHFTCSRWTRHLFVFE